MTNSKIRVAAASGLAAFVAAAGSANAQVPCNGARGPDVIVGEITGPSNYTAANGLDALSLGTTSCNMGNELLMWNAFPSNTHPAIAGNLYKYSVVNGAGRFEQIGMSWLKHGFTALAGNVCCTCQNPGTGTRLGIGCSDPYTAARNGSQGGLGPRWQVNAATGFFPTGGPANPSWSGSTARRLEVALSDLAPSSATIRYFGESQYVSPDDAAAGNQNNNASYREMSCTGGPNEYSFGFIGSTVRQRSAIHAWKVIDPAVTLTEVQVPGDGLFIIGSKATNLGGGQWHYEYAVYNMNSDRNGGTFSIPVAPGTIVSNVQFKGVTYRNGDATNNTSSNTVNFASTSWATSLTGGVLTFSTQTQSENTIANAIRWGSTYNFRFDANVAPAAPNGSVTLGLWKSGTPASMSASAQVPGTPACVADMDNGSGSGTADGAVTVDDMLYFLGVFSNGSIRADIDNGSGNGVSDGGVTIDDLLYFVFRFESGC